jgi:hypothetical protein
VNLGDCCTILYPLAGDGRSKPPRRFCAVRWHTCRRLRGHPDAILQGKVGRLLKIGGCIRCQGVAGAFLAAYNVVSLPSLRGVFRAFPHLGWPQVMDTFQASISKSSLVPGMFSAMLGLRPNLTRAEFSSLAGFMLQSFPGLSTVGLNYNIT